MESIIKSAVKARQTKALGAKKVPATRLERKVAKALSSGDRALAMGQLIQTRNEGIARLNHIARVFAKYGVDAALLAQADPKGELTNGLKSFPDGTKLTSAMSPKSMLVRLAVEELEAIGETMVDQVQDQSSELIEVAKTFIADFGSTVQDLLSKLAEVANTLPTDFAGPANELSATLIAHQDLQTIISGLKAYSEIIFSDEDDLLASAVVSLPVDKDIKDGLGDAVAEAGAKLADFQQKRLSAKKGGNISVLFSETQVDEDLDSSEYVGYGSVWNPQSNTLDALGFTNVSVVKSLVDSMRELLLAADSNTAKLGVYFEKIDGTIKVLDDLLSISRGEDPAASAPTPEEQVAPELEAAPESEEGLDTGADDDTSDDDAAGAAEGLDGEEGAASSEEGGTDADAIAHAETEEGQDDISELAGKTEAELSDEERFRYNVNRLRQNVTELVVERERDVVTYGKALVAAATAVIAVVETIAGKTVEAPKDETNGEPTVVDTTESEEASDVVVTDESAGEAGEASLEDLVPQTDENGNPLVIGDDVSDPSFGGGEGGSDDAAGAVPPTEEGAPEPDAGEPEGDDDLDTGIEDDELDNEEGEEDASATTARRSNRFRRR